jgi:acyl transferase domain-containing protein/acyl carrier protein
MGHKFDTKLTREPIAIIGIGCRFPGADNLQSFWRILRDGIETICEYPGGRFNLVDHFYAAQSGGQPGSAVRRGGFLKNLDLFDADFFGISPREAILLDPQHRLLLELGWEALEDAGLPLGAVTGSRTGAFVGQWTSDFETCINNAATKHTLYSTTGSGRYAAAGRLAYHFDLRGPSLTVDTACSSSLVAVHLACQSLRAEESDLALAGGVNVILRPEITQAYGSAGMLSPDDRCKFGDASANGYVRSEAAAVLVLKLLERALADGDPIHAVIRGSSIQNDGRSSGLLVAPSREGQAATIRAALEDAGVSAAELDYIEAHGTGTAAGDPVELGAFGSVLGEGHREQPCLVGSVKTNVGHAESAAGMASLCKAILSLKHALIPASLHFREPNPNIPWSKLPLAISGEQRPWPHHRERRIASVNSIGITGTNAHVILENPPRVSVKDESPERARLFVISARTPAALEQTAASWRVKIADANSHPWPMADLAYTAANRRTSHACRLALVAKRESDLDSQLASWLEHEPGDLVHSGQATETKPRVVFVFPGQGGQWSGMGRELFALEPVFHETLTHCDRALRLHNDWSVIDEMMNPASAKSGEIDRVQPTLFALMVALAALWRSWGVEPEAVVGHSMGEVAAAVVCGALSLEDGAAVISKRSRLMKEVSGRGLMAMAALTFEEATEFVSAYGGRISVAANNSPSSTILSGDTDAIEEAIAALEAREIFCRRVQVDVASHCAQMDPLAPELKRSLTSIEPQIARIPLYSTATGRIEDGLSLGAAYWSRNLREPVLFSDAVQHLLREGFQTFVEINAHPVLLHAIEESAAYAGKEIQTVASLRREKEQLPEILASLGKLHVNGYPVNFRSLYPDGECLRLPAYPWERDRYWPEEESHAGDRRFHSRGVHPNLGLPVESSLEPGTYLCEVELRPPAGRLQAAGWSLDLIAAAACEILDARAIALEDVRFTAINAPSDSGQMAIWRHAEDGPHRFRLSSKSGHTWATYCEGSVQVHDRGGTPSVCDSPSVSTDTSTPPLIACLQAAAESLGYPSVENGEADWSVSRIDRVERFRGNGPDQVPMRAATAPVSETSANGELLDSSGSLVVRMLGAQFDFQRITDCSKHLYEWKWTEIIPSTAEDQPGVLVIAGDSQISAQIAECLRSRDVECVVAFDAASLGDVIEPLGSSCKAVIWTSSEQTSSPESAVDEVSDLWGAVRAITAVRSANPASLWLVTTGAHAIEGHSADAYNLRLPSASQTALWGLARVIAREHPELRCISIDLSSHPGADELDLLQRLVTSAASELQMAVRETKCYGLRLGRRTENDQPEVSLRRDGTYLITGGFGDLGLALAAFLAERGAGHIALVGRRPPSDAALERLAQIESHGATVHRFQADVANLSAITSVLEEIGNGAAPLKGVFHLAGITQDTLLADFDRASLESVMRPKVFGSWNLHSLTANNDLDFFVMYSSVAAVFSQPGQGSYAAANAYLDGLAMLRHASGLPALSIQWGPWKDAGMILESGANRSRLAWAEQGIGALDVATSLDSLHRLLARPVPVSFVGRVDWKRFDLGSSGKTAHLLSELFEPAAGAPQIESGISDQLASLPLTQRIKHLESHLKSIVAAVLKSKASRIDSTRRFGSLGVDSLMAVEIARRVTETLGIRLPVTAIFNFPTLELLAKEVARRLEPESQAAMPESAVAAKSRKTSAKPPMSAIAQMSEEEVLQSLVKAAETR